MPQRAFEHSEKENLPHDSNLAEKTAVQDFALTFPLKNRMLAPTLPTKHPPCRTKAPASGNGDTIRPTRGDTPSARLSGSTPPTGPKLRINEQTTRNPGNIGRRDRPHLFQTVGPQQSFEPGHIGFMRRARRGERQQARHEAAMAEETVEPGEKERIAIREKKIGREA